MSERRKDAAFEIKLKPFDFLELSNNSSKTSYCEKVKLIGGVDPNSNPLEATKVFSMIEYKPFTTAEPVTMNNIID